MDEFAPFLMQKGYGTFVVQNIANPPKVVNIFNYPISPNGGTRDLLQIPGVSPQDINTSCLKGEIKHKLRAKEITIINSDINLVGFNINQANFLYNSGVIEGVQNQFEQSLYSWQQDIELLGSVDGFNLVFTIPSGKFIFNNNYKVVVYKNGVKQLYLDDFFVAESGGVGTGYDTIIFSVAPAPVPSPPDVMTADYYLLNKP